MEHQIGFGWICFFCLCSLSLGVWIGHEISDFFHKSKERKINEEMLSTFDFFIQLVCEQASLKIYRFLKSKKITVAVSPLQSNFLLEVYQDLEKIGCEYSQQVMRILEGINPIIHNIQNLGFWKGMAQLNEVMNHVDQSLGVKKNAHQENVIPKEVISKAFGKISIIGEERKDV
ncbi:MAG: hypothetical protein OEV93_04050 [Candidatus Moranbacteria bacterium]|nr:hypothetical protein [Candidatus Moranbacteria bacterium]